MRARTPEASYSDLSALALPLPLSVALLAEAALPGFLLPFWLRPVPTPRAFACPPCLVSAVM